MSTLPHKNHFIIIKKKKIIYQHPIPNNKNNYKKIYFLRHGWYTISHFQSFDQKQRAEKSIEKERKKKKVYQMVVMMGAEAESQESEYC